MELTRFRFFSELLEETRSLDHAYTLLDAGAGDAWFASRMADRWGQLERIVCYDVEYGPSSPESLDITDPRIELTRQWPSGRFDLILALDVLEHVEHDTSFARRLAVDHLTANGVILISVPAWRSMSTEHDRLMLHHRRYNPGELQATLASAGLTPIRQGGLFHSLLLPRALSVLRERIWPARRENGTPLAWPHPRWLTPARASGIADGQCDLGDRGTPLAVPPRPHALGSMSTIIVVPCFNEESRLDDGSLADVMELSRAQLLLVDDGSTDNTRTRLEEIAQSLSCFVLPLPENCGKAEAVRRGLLDAHRARRDGGWLRRRRYGNASRRGRAAGRSPARG